MKNKAFTLAESLITIAIIGIVAALTIPSIIVNVQQHQYKTGLRKAISVLNSAITMNKAVNEETPYTNSDLFRFLQRNMNVLKSARSGDSWMPDSSSYSTYKNSVFYTTDGIRFEIANSSTSSSYPLYENRSIYVGGSGWYHSAQDRDMGCGSYGLPGRHRTFNPPCLIMVDVNGDKGPYPSNKCKDMEDDSARANCERPQPADPDGSHLTDVFSILITDSAAIPYGTAAQKAMYNEQKR